MKVVMKIGGSLMDSASDILKKVSEFTETEKNISILIVPGGGVFADTIRSKAAHYGIGDEAAHWMAILAMEQYAYYLIDKTGAKGIETIECLPSGFSILLPYRLLKTTDELPHSWDVTSDTIAAWVAKRLNARFVKVTDVDGIFIDGNLVVEVSAQELEKIETSCTDTEFPKFMKANSMDCVIVNGHYPDRVIDAVRCQSVTGTYMKGNI
ncbi:MAG: amino acid kinase [Methanosarcinaceae archaeon]|nr:amino acid kinase [Methanosarcinaceae archaeon]